MAKQSNHGLNEAQVKTIEYLVSVSGAQALVDLDHKLQQLDMRMQVGAHQFRAGAISLDEFLETATKLSPEMVTLGKQFQVATDRIMGTAGSAAEAEKRFQSLSFAILATSQGIEDFTMAGLRGVINNIPMAIRGLAEFQTVISTTPAGINILVGAITILASAGYALYQNFDRIKEAMGLSGTETEAERMERLANKTHKTAEETAELNKHKKEQARIEQMMHEKSEQAKKTEEAIGGVYAEMGQEKIKAGIIAANYPGGLGSKDEELLRLQDAKARREKEGLLDMAQMVQEKIDARITALNDKANEDAQKLMDAARTKPNEFLELMGKARRMPGSFPAGFAAELAKTTPESRMRRLEMEISGEEIPIADLPIQQQDAERKRRAAKDRREDKARAKALGQMEEDQEKDALRDRLAADRFAKQVADMKAGQKKIDEAQAKQDRDFRMRANEQMARETLKNLDEHGIMSDRIRGQFARNAGRAEVAEALTPDVTERLSHVPTIQADRLAEVVQAAINQLIEKVAAEGAGPGGFAGAQRALDLKRQAATDKLTAAGERDFKNDQHDAFEQFFQAHGANARQSSALADKTLALVAKGLDVTTAVQMAQWQQAQEIQSLWMRVNHIGRQQKSRMNNQRVQRFNGFGNSGLGGAN